MSVSNFTAIYQIVVESFHSEAQISNLIVALEEQRGEQ